MAVTYPARRLYGIKRGDGWDVVEQKSGGRCLAIHLPILRNGASVSEAQVVDDNVELAYQNVYGLGTDQRRDVLRHELGKRRSNSEGKACLERYRLASTRIFRVVLETLQDRLGKDKFVLERASIDELFLDVTHYCWSNIDNNNNSTPTTPKGVEQVMDKTVHVGKPDTDTTKRTIVVEENDDEEEDEEDDSSVVRALQMGCWVGQMVRQAVLDKLGFTLSAGVSTSKTVAKLGASYGKPNGQAVVYPSCIPYVMDQTPIRKVRNLGGKIGQRVCQLLQKRLHLDGGGGGDSPKPTMGDIARHLPLPVLSEAFGHETARWIFDAARGLDKEPVRETVGALVKSITAFKSFFPIRLTSGEIVQYFELLSSDMVSRVQLDAQRNHRYPKSCTVHYSCSGGSGPKQRRTKSVRIAFPKQQHKVELHQMVAERARQAILDREGPVDMHRIGLSAMEFVTSMAHGGGGGSIGSYFANHNNSSNNSSNNNNNSSSSSSNNNNNNSSSNKNNNNKKTAEKKEDLGIALQERNAESNKRKHGADQDLELARKLQARFDREHDFLTRANQSRQSNNNNNKRSKSIQSFFFRAKS